MTNLSQRDLRWRFKKLGYCGTTIGANGCVVTSIAMMKNSRPDTINDLMKNGGAFVNGCLAWWPKVASIFNMEWNGTTAQPTFYPTIGEVKMANGIKHFVIFLNAGTIIDPIDGRQKQNPYRVMGYRNLRPKQASAPAQPPSQPGRVYPKQVTVKVPALMVRSQPTSQSPLAGSRRLTKGTTITVIGSIRGERYLGNDLWYISIKKNYVWSGGF